MAFLDIFQAARRADLNQFKHLLDSADLNAVTTDKRSLLHISIAYGRMDNCFELIQRGVNLNCQDASGATPLHYAVTYSQIETARLILEHGGNPSITDEHGNAPLWNAVFNAKGRYDMVILLLQNGASATLKNKHGRSPLDFAQQIEDKELIGILCNGLT